MAHHILLTEDEAPVAKGLTYALEHEGFTVAWATSGKQTMQRLQEQPPDLFILDVRLPDMSGFDICRHLRTNGHKQPILMLTARDEEVDKVLGLELGADDYVVKPYNLRELISRIRALLRRAYGELAPAATAERLSFGEVVIDSERLLVTRRGQPVELTPTEFRLLRFLAMHPERAFSRNDLIEMVWGYDSEVYNERTVDVHMRHLREKLETDPTTPRHLTTIRGIGYLFVP